MTEQERSRGEVLPERPRLAEGYGISAGEARLLPWSYVDERMESSRNYWVATTRPDGRPSVTLVWGIWIDSTFYFGVDPHSRKARNLARNPEVVVHLESDDEVVMLEGAVELVTEPDPALSERVSNASLVKYGMRMRSGSIEGPYALRPRVAFAWAESNFSENATRWRFDCGLPGSES